MLLKEINTEMCSYSGSLKLQNDFKLRSLKNLCTYTNKCYSCMYRFTKESLIYEH